MIRSLYYNKKSQALVTVSVYRADNFSSLKCRNTHLEYIRRGQPNAGFPIFESECLRWPGFVEFDDVNSKVLTFSASSESREGAYRVWSMHNYDLLFTLRADNVTEVKISPAIMLLIHARQGGYVPLKIVSIEDGKELKSFNHLLHRTKKVEFIEQFNEKLLVKQEGENLNIVDVHTGSVTSVSKTEFVTPSAFIFLYENNLFLTIRQRHVTVWNFRGEQVSSFEDHTLWHPDSSTNNIFITSAQDYIISFCRPKDYIRRSSSGSEEALLRSDPDAMQGEVHISHILTGRCIAKLNGLGKQVGSVGAEQDPNGQSAEDGNDALALTQHDASEDGLGDVSALHFSEERNELFVGNRQGILYIFGQ